LTPDLHGKHQKLAILRSFAPISLSLIVAKHQITCLSLLFHEKTFFNDLISKGNLFDPSDTMFFLHVVRTPLGWMAVLQGRNSSYNISGMYEFITPVTGGLKDLPL
jgi:hypothetical protein